MARIMNTWDPLIKKKKKKGGETEEPTVTRGLDANLQGALPLHIA